MRLGVIEECRLQMFIVDKKGFDLWAWVFVFAKPKDQSPKSNSNEFTELSNAAENFHRAITGCGVADEIFGKLVWLATAHYGGRVICGGSGDRLF